MTGDEVAIIAVHSVIGNAVVVVRVAKRGPAELLGLSRRGTLPHRTGR